MANEVALIPVSDMQIMADAVAKSGLFGIKTREQAFALMLIAHAENRHPATVARDYDIIQGRPAKKTEAMLRDFIEAGGKVEWHKLDDTVAEATFSHPQGGTVRLGWNMQRAVQAGLKDKDNWKKYPRQMLRNRTVSEGIRTVCPSATSGMYEPGEVRDMPAAEPEKIINPVRNALEGSPEPSPDEMEALRELAATLVDMVETDGNPMGAYQHLADQNLDDEQKLRVWLLLKPNSKTRSALKKEGAIREKDSRREAINAVEDLQSPPAA
jgi:hypothetical protein